MWENFKNALYYSPETKMMLDYAGIKMDDGFKAEMSEKLNNALALMDELEAGAIANQNCAAIEIDNYQSPCVGAAHKLTTSDNTYGSNFSGEWRIKNFVDGNPITVNNVEYTQIAIDGKLMTIDSNKNVTVNE